MYTSAEMSPAISPWNNTANQPGPRVATAQISATIAELHDALEEFRRLRLELRHELLRLQHSLSVPRDVRNANVEPGQFRHSEARPAANSNRLAHSAADTELIQKLSPREIEVLGLIGEGYRTKETAFRLRITFKTVVTHRSNIAAKLGIHEGPNLVRFAIRTGLCEP